MTRDKILNMPTGQQMDELVAEHVMKWHKVDEHGFLHWKGSNGQYMCGVGRYDGYEDGEDFHTLNWHPSESMLWAWQVVEKVGIGYLLQVDDEQDSNKKSWVAMCHHVGYSMNINVKAEADTPPLAICRASLLAVMELE